MNHYIFPTSAALTCVASTKSVVYARQERWPSGRRHQIANRFQDSTNRRSFYEGSRFFWCASGETLANMATIQAAIFSRTTTFFPTDEN